MQFRRKIQQKTQKYKQYDMMIFWKYMKNISTGYERSQACLVNFLAITKPLAEVYLHPVHPTNRIYTTSDNSRTSMWDHLS